MAPPVSRLLLLCLTVLPSRRPGQRGGGSASAGDGARADRGRDNGEHHRPESAGVVTALAAQTVATVTWLAPPVKRIS